LLLANVCKQNITRFPYEIARLAEDIAGGLMVTMASEKDCAIRKSANWSINISRESPQCPPKTAAAS